MANLEDTLVTGVTTQTVPASLPGHLVRLGELVSLLQGYQMIGSGIPASGVTGLTAFVDDIVENIIQGSFSILVTVDSGVPSVTLSAIVDGNRALAIDSQGIYVILGSGSNQAAPGNHSHSGIPIIAVNVHTSESISFGAFDGRQIPAEFQGGGQITDLYAHVVAVMQGGILVTGSGVEADFGPNPWQVARGSDLLALANAVTALQQGAITVANTNSIDLLLLATQLTANLNTHPGSGIQITSSGVEVIWGNYVSETSPPGTVAPGNHTHLLLHPPVQTVNTPSIKMGVDVNQVISGVLTCDPDPPVNFGLIATGVNGVSVVLGTDSDTAAAGDHTHSIVSLTAAGFMSPELLAELQNQTADILTIVNQALTAAISSVDDNVNYYRESVLLQAQYVGGRYRWENTVEIRGVNLTAQAPAYNQYLNLEVDGIVYPLQIMIPSGLPGTEVFNEIEVGGLFVSVQSGTWTPHVRWVCTSGTGTVDQMAAQIAVSMTVRPSINFS